MGFASIGAKETSSSGSGLSVFIAFPDAHVSEYSRVHAIALFSCSSFLVVILFVLIC